MHPGARRWPAPAAAAAGGPHRSGKCSPPRKRRALRPLPEAPFELATWSRPKVGPDAHVGKTLYSVPWRLIGKRLDARATGEMVRFYLDGELVKTHPPRPGAGAPTGPICPTSGSAFSCAPQWCRSQAAAVGPACQALVDELLSVNALFRLGRPRRAAAGPRQGDARLEAACARALEAGDPSYKTVKGVLAAGTEGEASLPLPRGRRPRLAARPGRIRRVEQQ